MLTQQCLKKVLTSWADDGVQADIHCTTHKIYTFGYQKSSLSDNRLWNLTLTQLCFVCFPAGSACGRRSESVSGEEGERGAGLQRAWPLQLQPLSYQQLLQRRLGQPLLHLPRRSVCSRVRRDRNILQGWKVKKKCSRPFNHLVNVISTYSI